MATFSTKSGSELESKAIELLKARRFREFKTEKELVDALEEYDFVCGYCNDCGWITFYSINDNFEKDTLNRLNRL